MMTNLQGWIWVTSLVIGFITIMLSLEEIESVAFLFLLAGFMTIVFLLEKIHKLELKIERLEQPIPWD